MCGFSPSVSPTEDENGIVSVTYPEAAEHSLFADVSPILTQSFTLGIVGDGVFRDTDRFGLLVNQPLRVTRGSAELAVLRGHEELVNDAAFSPNGERVVTVSRDSTTRLWDAEKGTQIALLPGHERQVWSVAFSPDGRHVLTASVDRTARIFSVFQTTQDLIDHAKSIVPRELTPCERKRFFLPVEAEVGDCPN